MDLSKRNTSLDILRILACIAVITIHTPSIGRIGQLAQVGTIEWIGYIIPLALSKWSVPVFMMLTGAFLLSPNHAFSYVHIYKRRIPHILVVLIVWNIFYMCLVDKKFKYCVLTSQYHFWYLGMLLGLYLIIPMLRSFVKDPIALKSFCYTWFVYLLYDWLGNFCTLPIQLIDNVFVDSIGYATWGYYLTTIRWNSVNKIVPIYVCGGGGIALAASVILWIVFPDYGSVIANYHSPITALVAFGVFVFFYSHPIKNDTPFARKIYVVSELTLGIYMLHVYVGMHVFCRMLRFVPIPFLTVILSVLLTFVLSGIVIYFIRKIPYIGKWIA